MTVKLEKKPIKSFFIIFNWSLIGERRRHCFLILALIQLYYNLGIKNDYYIKKKYVDIVKTLGEILATTLIKPVKEAKIAKQVANVKVYTERLLPPTCFLRNTNVKIAFFRNIFFWYIFAIIFILNMPFNHRFCF